MFLTYAAVETHDRIVGRTYREVARACEAQLGDESAKRSGHSPILGTALIGARRTVRDGRASAT